MLQTQLGSQTNFNQKLLKSVIKGDDYFKANPDAKKAGLDALTHWREFGWREGCLPNTLFLDAEWDGFRHRQEDPIVAWDHDHGSVDFRNEVMHKKHGLFNICSRYLAESLGELNPLLVLMYTEKLCLIFDRRFYGQENQLSHLHPGLLLRHYLRFGWKTGLSPAENYDADKIKTILNGRGLASEIYTAQLSGRDLGKDKTKRLKSTSLGVARSLPKLSKTIFERTTQITFTDEELKLFKQYFDAKSFSEFAGLQDKLQFEEVLKLYLDIGWRNMPDTGKGFDADFYTRRYNELDGAKISPLEHYIRFGRAEQRQPQSRIDEIAKNYEPLVSIIVPNFNHEKFLERRLASIEKQTHRNIEVILLDDNSTDKSRKILKSWAKRQHAFSIKLEFNKTNSGSVFSQWERGIALASGELIWICESDDSCESDFLETLVPHFSDTSINMALGCIEFINADDEHIDGMAGFRHYSEPDIWNSTITRSAAEWFAGAWGINNIVANVGGSLFRKKSLPRHVFNTAKTYKIAGDWYIYTHLIGSGRMVFEPNAVAYFRQHDHNTSASNFNKLYYYEELARIRAHIRNLWPADIDVDLKFMQNVQAQWQHYNMPGVLEEEVSLFSQEASRKALHIVIAYLGPRVGGGEIIATHLANALAELSTDDQPIFVSLFAHTLHDPSPILEREISDKVSLYSVETALEYASPVSFLKAISADVVNSHMCLNDEYFLKKTNETIDIPYTVTLHGSHQGSGGAPLPDDFLMALLLGVDLWLYTADQNLKILRGIQLNDCALKQIPNAMPRDERPAEVSRNSLGISKKAFVFTLVARGIERKGWRASIEGFLQLLERRPGLNIHLLLVGDGPRVKPLRAEYSSHEKIHFLGYQSSINGIYRLSDCALLPTRFEGESYPLCLIQALMEGVPAISGDVGFIKDMMTIEAEEMAGFTVEPVRDTEIFIRNLSVAMEKMLDKQTYKNLKRNAVIAGNSFDMDDLAKEYLKLFVDAVDNKKCKNS